MRGIYIEEGVRSGKIPARYPTKTSVVGFAMSKHQERVLGSYKGVFIGRRGMQRAQSDYSEVEILLSSQGAKKKNLEGLL